MGNAYTFPGCAAIGWIPYASLPLYWPPCCHELVRRAPTPGERMLRWAGFWGLFLTGNVVPPFSYPTFEHLERRLGKHQHRAALGFDDVELRRSAGGLWTPRSRVIRKRQIGITRPPFRLSLPFQSKWLRGRGDVYPILVRSGTVGAVMSQQVDFRLSRMVDVGSYRTMGHYAPRAWMKMAYHLRGDGNGTLVMRGSFVPSRTTYSGLARKSEESVHRLSADELWGFISCGENVRAPGRQRVCLAVRGRPA